MPTPTDLVNAARLWIDTPYADQGRLRGVGCDCIGLIVGAFADIGVILNVPANYGRTPDPALLYSALSATGVADPIAPDDRQIGDVLLFKVKTTPQHFAILSTADDMIHAHDGARVAEVKIAKWIEAGKLLQAYRYSGF